MKISFKPLYIAALGILCILLAAFSRFDDGFLKRAIAQLQKWTDTYPQEKVYLHLDKPYYAAGDNLWFKAYVTIGPEHQLSALSNVLNVELIDGQDSVRKSLKLIVINGVCTGDIALSDSLAAGTYRLRAYTAWMRNFSAAYFYDRPLLIGNAVAGDLLATAAYSYKPQQTTATVTYTNINQIPYAGKPVNYTIKLDDRRVARGRGTTDGQGKLSISFPTLDTKNYQSGQLVSEVKVGDGKPVESVLTFTPAAGQTDVQFFPEGGNLVSGVASTVAFKAVGSNGLGAEVQGSVLDNNNQQVAGIQTAHLGMGSFVIRPEAGKTYRAVITFPDGSQRTLPLPGVTASGYGLSVRKTAAEFRIKISASADLAGQNNGGEISLVAQTGGKVYYAGKTTLQGTSNTSTIPISRFPSGVVQFTLFSGAGQPVAERLAFVRNPADQLQVAITPDKTTYQPKEQSRIKMHVQNAAGKPAIGYFSAAVIDETRVPVDESGEETIQSNLLLTADLQGYIEQPGYYFNRITDKVDADLDLLLLTQGYRRFNWKSLLAEQFTPVAYQPEKSFRISGVLKTLGGKPVSNGRVTLFSTSGGAFILDTVSNAQGRFAFNNLLFKDSVRFIVQARTGKNSKNVQVVLDEPMKQPTAAASRLPDFLTGNNTNYNVYLQNSRLQYQNDTQYGLNGRTIVLKEVVIRERRQAPLKYSTNLNGAGSADQIIKSDVFERLGCVNIAQCLQGRLVGVIFRGNVPYSTRSFNRPMQVIVDGVYVDGDYLTSLNPYDIGSVEVLRTIGYTAIYGSQGANGVLIINTKRGDERNYSSLAANPGVVTYMPKGFFTEREFYKPVYQGPKAASSTIADLRTTIHWEKNLVPDSAGNVIFSYYNADGKGTYRIAIEGISIEGYPGRQVYRYQVGN